MKKTYQNPETTIITIELQHICTGSIGIGEDYNDGNILSREFDYWE